MNYPYKLCQKRQGVHEMTNRVLLLGAGFSELADLPLS